MFHYGKWRLMLTRSSKAKGKTLERYIRDKLIQIFHLASDEIRCTISSENGEDLKLSKSAQEKIPLKIEAKSRKTMALYAFYEQAKGHPGELEPVVIVKANRKPVLIIVDLDYFLKLLKGNK